MGSVINSIICPQCGYEEAYYEYYYKFGEEYTFCPLCGYRKEHCMKQNEEGGWIMQTDVYEIDGKTVGYSRLDESNEAGLLSDFTPFDTENVVEELRNMENNPDVYIIKLDIREDDGFHYLSFWFSREIKYENGKPFLHHTYPIFVDTESGGAGICCVSKKDCAKALYDIRDVDLDEMLRIVQQPEYKETSYITKVENGQVEVLAGTLPWSEEE